MVLYAEVVKSKPEFHVAWLLGTGGSRKLSRREILSQNLPELCVSIIGIVPEKDKSTSSKAGLYLLSLLTHGTILIHREQVAFLQRDVEKLKELMRKKSFIMIMAEKFDREQAIQNEENGRKLRSTPIVCVEDVDDWVNLENLPIISEQLGINGDPRDFTMMDALPDLSQWNPNADLTGLYGSVESYSSQKNLTLHSTFVEGNGSGGQSRERKSATENIYAENQAFIPPTKVLTNISDKEPESNRQADLTHAQLESRENNDGIRNRTPTPEEIPGELLVIQNELPPNPLSSLEQHIPLEQEAIDLFPIPIAQQDEFTAYLRTINELPDGNTLPPLPNDLELFEDSVPPPPKKQKIIEETDDLERARRRPSSRPLTPINLNELTDLHSTRREEELNSTLRLEESNIILDSINVFPTRKKSKRILAINYDDMQIDEAVQGVLEADYSPLVRKMTDMIVNIPEKPDNFSSLMNLPEPILSFGNRISKEVRDLFKSTYYSEYRGSLPKINEGYKDDEETLKYATLSLVSPQRIIEEENIQIRTPKDPFEEEYRPIQLDQLTTQPQLEENVIIEEVQPFTTIRETPPAEDLKYAFTKLLPTPEKERESAIMETLNLEPIPNNTENINFSNENYNVLHGMEHQGEETNGLERARQTQKSSLVFRADDLKDETEKRAFEYEERIRLAMEAREDNLFFFSSGSLLPNNRLMIYEELLTESEKKYPDWVDFNQFTANHDRKKAATAFDGLLLGLKNTKVRAKQDRPFGIILVQHVTQDT